MISVMRHHGCVTEALHEPITPEQQVALTRQQLARVGGIKPNERKQASSE